MKLPDVFILRRNGALIAEFSTGSKTVTYMVNKRKNGEFWRIEKKEVK